MLRRVKEAKDALTGKKTLVNWNRTDVKAYLDRCIGEWRKHEDRVDNLEDAMIANTYISAFQSIREALFGESLPDEELKKSE